MADVHVPYFVSANLVDHRGIVLAQCDSRLVDLWLDPATAQRVTLRMSRPWLLPGDYRIDLFVCSAGIIDAVEGACHFAVGPTTPYPGGGIEEALASSSVLPEFDYTAVTKDDEREGPGAAGDPGGPTYSRTGTQGEH